MNYVCEDRNLDGGVGVRGAVVGAAHAAVAEGLFVCLCGRPSQGGVEDRRQGRVVGQPEPEQHVITIPAGTAIRLSSGHDVDIIPADLNFRLRDQLVVINEDSTAHQIGPFVIPAGERLDTRFAEAATLEGFCSLHSSGRVTINVSGT